PRSGLRAGPGDRGPRGGARPGSRGTRGARTVAGATVEMTNDSAVMHRITFSLLTAGKVADLYLSRFDIRCGEWRTAVESPRVNGRTSPATPESRENPARGRPRRLAKMRAWIRRKEAPVMVMRQPVAPSVVLACAKCGFDYTVTRLVIAGKTGLVWTCECGSQFIPPGGS